MRHTRCLRIKSVISMQTGFCAYKKLDFWIFCGLIALFGHLTLSGRHFMPPVASSIKPTCSVRKRA